MPTNPNYTVTPALFARARADIARRRAQLDERHEAAAAVIISYDATVALLDAELVELDACELTTEEIVERFAEAVPRRSKPRARALKADGLPRRTNASRPYKREEDERIAAATRGELEHLAQDLGRSYKGVLKRHEVLLKRSDPSPVGPPSWHDSPDPIDHLDEVLSGEPPALEPSPARVDEIETAAPSEALGSENPEIVEPTDAHEAAASTADEVRGSPAARELAEFDGRRKRAGQARPGIPVRGLTNDGPGYDRDMDPVAWASRGGGV